MLISISMSVFSQSVDLDRFHAKFNYRSLAKKPLSKDQRTFSVKANFSDVVSAAYSRSEYEQNAIKIEGLKKVDADAGLKVVYSFSPINVSEINVLEIKHEDKDKDGNVTKVYYTYAGIMKYRLQSSVQFLDKSGTEIFVQPLNSSSSEKVYQSQDYKEYKEAATYIKLNKDMLVDKLTVQFIANDNKEVNATANELFGYKAYSDNMLFWYLGSEKHPEFKAHSDNFAQVKAIIEKMTADGGVGEARDLAKPLISYLEDVKARYTEDNKKHKKMRYASFFNLAQIYYLTDQPDEVIKQAEGLIANDYDSGDGKTFIKKANELKQLLQNNGVESRHFQLD